MVASTEEFVGLFSSRLSFTSNLLNRPLTGVIIMCFAENSTAEWAGSGAQVGWPVIVPVAWLVFGVALLLVGVLLRSQPARLASAAVILITVGKVFLLDLAGLTGVYRALSFLGLGLVLIGIGLLYQRWLFPRTPPASPSATQDAPRA